MKNKLMNQVYVLASSILVINGRKPQIQLTETAKEKWLPHVTVKSKGETNFRYSLIQGIEGVPRAGFSLHLLAQLTAVHLHTGYSVTQLQEGRIVTSSFRLSPLQAYVQ